MSVSKTMRFVPGPYCTSLLAETKSRNENHESNDFFLEGEAQMWEKSGNAKI